MTCYCYCAKYQQLFIISALGYSTPSSNILSSQLSLLWDLSWHWSFERGIILARGSSRQCCFLRPSIFPLLFHSHNYIHTLFTECMSFSCPHLVACCNAKAWLTEPHSESAQFESTRIILLTDIQEQFCAVSLSSLNKQSAEIMGLETDWARAKQGAFPSNSFELRFYS